MTGSPGCQHWMSKDAKELKDLFIVFALDLSAVKASRAAYTMGNIITKKRVRRVLLASSLFFFLLSQFSVLLTNCLGTVLNIQGLSSKI